MSKQAKIDNYRKKVEVASLHADSGQSEEEDDAEDERPDTLESTFDFRLLLIAAVGADDNFPEPINSRSFVNCYPY